MLSRGDDEPVKRAWDLKVNGIREKGRPRISRTNVVKKESSINS